MTTLYHLPLNLVLVAAWVGAHAAGIDLTFGGAPSLAVTVLSLVTIMWEFYKSGDILLRRFEVDLCFAVVGTVAGTVSMTLLAMSGAVGIVDGFVGGVLFFDAVLSPINSYRSALRMVQAGVNMAPPEVR